MSYFEIAFLLTAILAVACCFLAREGRRMRRVETEEVLIALRRQEQANENEMARNIVGRCGGYEVLPTFGSILFLDHGEVSFFDAPAALVALRTARTITTFSGASGRVSMRGVTARTGVVESSSISIEELRDVDEGSVSVTSRRVLFHGVKGNSSIRLNKVVAAYCSEEGLIRLDRENGRPLMINSRYSALVFAYVQRLLDDMRNGVETEYVHIDLEAERQRLGLPASA